MLFWNCTLFYSLDLLGCANFAFRREAYVGPARRRDIVSIAQWIEWHDSAPVVGPTMEQLFGSFQETFCPSPCASRSVILVDCAIYTCARPKMSQWRVQRPCSTVKYTLYVKKCLLVLGEFDCASAIGCQADDSWTVMAIFFYQFFFRTNIGFSRVGYLLGCANYAFRRKAQARPSSRRDMNIFWRQKVQLALTYSRFSLTWIEIRTFSETDWLTDRQIVHWVKCSALENCAIHTCQDANSTVDSTKALLYTT